MLMFNYYPELWLINITLQNKIIAGICTNAKVHVYLVYIQLFRINPVIIRNMKIPEKNQFKIFNNFKWNVRF